MHVGPFSMHCGEVAREGHDMHAEPRPFDGHCPGLNLQVQKSSG